MLFLLILANTISSKRLPYLASTITARLGAAHRGIRNLQQLSFYDWIPILRISDMILMLGDLEEQGWLERTTEPKPYTCWMLTENGKSALKTAGYAELNENDKSIMNAVIKYFPE